MTGQRTPPSPERAVSVAAGPAGPCRLHDTAARGVRHSGRRRCPAIFPRPLWGWKAAPPAPSLPTTAGLRLGYCGLPKVTPPAPRGAGPGSPRGARTGSPALRSPPRAAPPAQRGWARDPSKGARPSRHRRGPPAPQAPLPPARSRPAAHSPPRGLAASARRPGAGPCPSAAAEETLRGHGCWGGTRQRPSFSAFLPPPPGPPLPAGRGLSRPYRCGGAGSGRGEGPALRGAAALGRAVRTHTGRGAVLALCRSWGSSGAALGRCEGRGPRVTSAQHPPPAPESAPRESGVTCRALPASSGCSPPGLAPLLRTGRFVTVARPLRAGSGVCHVL